jgi:polyisoprenoid-binding protein YceI
MSMFAPLLALSLITPVLGAKHRTAPACRVDSSLIVWAIDKTHSELSFRIRHMVSRVRGTFTDWDGRITGAPGRWAEGSVQVNIRTASIATNNDRRDNHLRSPDFFDAANYPEMTFRSTRVEFQGEEASVAGDLTIRGVTRPVILRGHFLGLQRGPDGKERVGFDATTRINRLDYGVSWNRAVEGGGALLGDEVDIEVVVAAVRQ